MRPGFAVRRRVHRSATPVMVQPGMTWVPWAQRRLQRSPRYAHLLALALATEGLVPRPVQAAARSAIQAPTAAPDCPEALDADPPSEALALKNAAQEMRAAQSWAKASRLFRDAVEELPDCATYADERLLWSLRAVDTFRQAEIADDGTLLNFTEDSVRRLEAIPGGSQLPDYPRLVAARDELQDGARWRPRLAREPQSARPQLPLAQRLGLGLMIGGGGLLLAGTVVTGIYSARANALTQQLSGPGGVYEQWAAEDCGPTIMLGESSRCSDLRADQAELRRDGFAANRAVIGSLVMVSVGAAVVLAGLGTYLHGRRAAPWRERSTLRLLPTAGGLVFSGRF